MSAALPPPTEALRQLREVIPFRLRLAFNSNEIEEGNLRVVRDSAERAASEIEWSHKAWEQARADLEAENAELKRKLEEARALLQGIVETAADMARTALKEQP